MYMCRQESLVKLVDRAVHPLFVSAICQLEVEVDGKPTKLGDLYTHEVGSRGAACALGTQRLAMLQASQPQQLHH